MEEDMDKTKHCPLGITKEDIVTFLIIKKKTEK